MTAAEGDVSQHSRRNDRLSALSRDRFAAQPSQRPEVW